MKVISKTFREARRQKFADEEAFNFSDQFAVEQWFPDLKKWSEDPGLSLEMRASYALQLADTRYAMLVRAYTAGKPIEQMRQGFEAVIGAYRDAARIDREFEQTPSLPLFYFKHLDDYQRILSILSLSILLHREDLILDIHGLFKDGAPDGEDALVEDLLGKYLPDRPFLSSGFHDGLCMHLLDATADTPMPEKQQDIEAYLKIWYPGMRGTGWYDSHKKQSPKGAAGYFGYWAFEAAAISYLYSVDDAPFRDHLIYPKDLADFARSMPKGQATDSQGERLRCKAGDLCPQAGWWFTPAMENCRRQFDSGALMPSLSGDYGETIWQWDINQNP